MRNEGRGSRHRPSGRVARAAVATATALGALLALGVVSVAGAPAASAKSNPLVQHYGPSPLQSVAVFPARQPGAPLIVLVHGGGFNSTAPMWSQTFPNAQSLETLGFAVFDVNYRGDSPATPGFPEEVDDVVAGTQWAVTNATRYDANPSDVVLIGGSSGAALAALASQQLDGTDPGLVKLTVTLSGAADWTTLVPYWVQVKATDKTSNRIEAKIAAQHLKNETRALGCEPKQPLKCSATTETLWSPALQATSQNCPANWLVFNGTQEDQPLAQADELTSALTAAGCTVSEEVLPGKQHSFDYWPKALPLITSAVQAGIAPTGG